MWNSSAQNLQLVQSLCLKTDEEVTGMYFFGIHLHVITAFWPTGLHPVTWPKMISIYYSLSKCVPVINMNANAHLFIGKGWHFCCIWTLRCNWVKFVATCSTNISVVAPFPRGSVISFHYLCLQVRFVRNVTSWREMKPGFYHGHVAYLDFSK